LANMKISQAFAAQGDAPLVSRGIGIGKGGQRRSG
jgi:hypothetical protein